VALDYSLVRQIAVGLFLLVAGGLITRFFERRARLVVFFGHVGQFRLQLQPPGTIHTHAVIIRNVGRVAAKNVHVPHRGLLNANNIHVSIEPPLAHTLQTLPNNTEEILFPTLPAKFQVTVSYLYFPPIVFSQINAPIYSDEGLAREIKVLQQQQWPKWVLALLWLLIVIGFGTVCYALIEVIRRVTP
jgi:hypothetical protein